MTDEELERVYSSVDASAALRAVAAAVRAEVVARLAAVPVPKCASCGGSGYFAAGSVTACNDCKNSNRSSVPCLAFRAAMMAALDEPATSDPNADPWCATCGHAQSDHRPGGCGASVERRGNAAKCRCSRFDEPAAKGGE